MRLASQGLALGPVGHLLHACWRITLALAAVVVAGALVLAFQLGVFSGAGAPNDVLQTGLDLHRQGRYEEAIAEFTRLIDEQSGLPEAYVFRGIALHSAERFGEAIQDFSAALEMDPENITVLLYRGESYLALGQQEAAAEDFQAVIEAASADSRLVAAAHAKLRAMER